MDKVIKKIKDIAAKVVSWCKDNKQKILKVLSVIANVLVWMFVALSLIITVLVFTAQNSEDGVPAIFGKSLITIETGSMEPTYEVGDLVFMTKLSEEEKANLKVGDIITFRTTIDINGDGQIGDINTHRIHSKTEGTLSVVTKGDHNLVPDNEGDTPYTVHYSEIIGICTEDGKIAGLGNVITFLRSSLGFFLCIVLPLILFFLYELYSFITLLVSERAKRAKAGTVPEETEEEIKCRAIEEYIKAQAEAAARAEKERAEEEIKRRAVEEYIKAQEAARAAEEAAVAAEAEKTSAEAAEVGAEAAEPTEDSENKE